MHRAAALLSGVVAFSTATTTIAAPAKSLTPKLSLDVAATTPQAASARHGVIVIGVGATPSDATWPVASAVYAVDSLRTSLSEKDARVLAGEAPGADALAATKDLGELRAKVAGDDVASRAMLAELTRRTGAVAAILVIPGTTDDPRTQSKLYDAADDRIEAAFYGSPGAAPWAPLTGALTQRYAAPATPTAPTAAAAPSPLVTDGQPSGSMMALAPTPAEPKTADSGTSTPFLKSPWFWGAIGAALAIGATTYFLTRDSGSSSTPAVQVNWGH